MIKISKVKEAYSEIESVVGEDYVSDKDFMKAAYSRNVDPAFPDRWADIIVRPETTEEVSEIVKIANKYKIRMVPRGGGADLVGGSVTEQGILIDLTRMNQIEEFNKEQSVQILENALDKVLLKLVGDISTQNYVTIGPTIRFLVSKEFEIKNLKIIAKGINEGLKHELIKSLLITEVA